MIGSFRKKSLLAASAVIAASALALTAIPAQASRVGVTKTSIKLGITVPLTGPASPGYAKVAPAMKAYFEYVNANGGVNGRKINLIIKDDKYLPQEAVNRTNELILRDKVFAIVGALGTANNLAVNSKVRLGARGVPTLFVNTGFSGFANKRKFPTLFPLFPSYAMEAKVMGTYIKENFAGKKLGLIVQNDDFGQDALKGFATAGVKFDETIKYVSGTQSATTATTWIQKLAAARVEVVYLFGVSTATAAALAVAAQAGYRPQWILGSVGGDATTIRTATAVPVAVLNGALGASFMPDAADTADEYVKFFREINNEYNKGVDFDNNVLAGMNGGMMVAQALKAAGPKPTRKKLIAAIENRGASFASAGLAPLAFSRTSRVGYTGYWIGKYNATGAIIPVEAKNVIYTTDSGNGPVVKGTSKRPALPTKGLPE
ncbi:MAG: ABC transporter substrate-binding protein [Actinobacteria bacterium]|nr:ABC transporter substrate-binding protein [Actinomycetota bacterium]